MLEAARIFLEWVTARLRLRAPVRLSIRDTYVLYVAWSCLLLSLVAGGILCGVERGAGSSPAYVDCLFQVASAVSSTGLIVLDTSQLQAGSHAILFLSMALCANTLLVTQVPVVLRILRVRASRAAAAASAAALAARHAALEAAGQAAAAEAAAAAAQQERAQREAQLVDLGALTMRVAPRSTRGALPAAFSGTAAGASSDGCAPPQPAPPSPPPSPPARAPPEGRAFSADPAKELAAVEAGGCDEAAVAAYLAAKAAHEAHARALAAFLAGPELLGYHWCLFLGVGYYLIIVGAGFVAFCGWGAASASARALLERNATPAGGTGQLAWFSLFHSLSLFTNSGFMMVADNMVQFGRDTFFVVASGVVAALGFSYYPLGFRLFVRAAHAALPRRWAAHRAAVADLLAHPRKYTTHLFSVQGTWALVYMSLATQALLFSVFLVFEFNADYFTGMFPRSEDRAMNGWFASLMVYNAGFNTYDLSFMNQGVVVFMVCCMWLTGRPFFVGILATAEEDASGSEEPAQLHLHHRGLTARQAVRNDLFATLFSDAWVCATCLALICFVDSDLMVSAKSGPALKDGTQAYIGIVPVLFDLASGYGNVGLSMGYPGTVTSSSAVLSPFSKLVMVFMMMHGCACAPAPPHPRRAKESAAIFHPPGLLRPLPPPPQLDPPSRRLHGHLPNLLREPGAAAGRGRAFAPRPHRGGRGRGRAAKGGPGAAVGGQPRRAHAGAAQRHRRRGGAARKRGRGAAGGRAPGARAVAGGPRRAPPAVAPRGCDARKEARGEPPFQG